MDLQLKGRHVYVSGASGGIGLKICELFLDNGANVTATYNANLHTLKQLDEKFPDQIHTVKCDVTKEEDVVDSFCVAASKYGPVEVLVVNQGIWPTNDTKVKDMTLEQFKNTIDINLTGSFLLCREFMKQISPESEQGPSIVMTTSTAAGFGEAGHADYAASKAALQLGLMLSLKNEIVQVHPRGRVNCVAPGWVRTPLSEEALSKTEVVDKALQTVPLHKVATCEDVAQAVLFLSSTKASGHVSGQTITVAGGMEGRVLWS